MRNLTGPGHKVTALEMSERDRLVLINTDLGRTTGPLLVRARARHGTAEGR